ncbi:hypothetical protein AB0L30_04860 [Microbispora rosea]|uniref:hypothetical protein n=1 Tax=Microbispora rosea TaxID=58117 RepID=UPI00343D62E4
MTWRAARITTWLDGQKINDFTDNASVEPLYDTVIEAVNVQDTAVRSAVAPTAPSGRRRARLRLPPFPQVPDGGSVPGGDSVRG